LIEGFAATVASQFEGNRFQALFIGRLGNHQPELWVEGWGDAFFTQQ
jgi:hypothetical protein